MDEAKNRIDEVIREVTRSISDAKARGATTKLLSYEDMFKRILSSAKKDPRITPKNLTAINEYAEKGYKQLAKAEGFSEHVVTDASVLRGHEVHVIIKMKSGVLLDAKVYADERIAIGTFNEWAKTEGETFTAQEIRIFEANQAEEARFHPLFLTNYYGSGVKTCPIR